MKFLTTLVSTLVGALVALVFFALPAQAGENSPWSNASGSSSKYFYYGDYIDVCDDSIDGHSVYANYKINNGTTNSTSQMNSGYPNCGRKNLGDIPAGFRVDQRAAVDIEGGANRYGPWKTGWS